MKKLINIVMKHLFREPKNIISMDQSSESIWENGELVGSKESIIIIRKF